MGLLDKHLGYRAPLEGIRSAGADPFKVRFDAVLSPTEGMLDGRKVILLGTNNYLGLTFDPACIDASAEAVRQWGTGTTGSRFANGTFSGHTALEQALAKFYDRRHAMVFTTGYQANLGGISGLVGRGDHLILDADSHASL
jgi:8-amino-7-oxononanoate synthase